MSDHPGRRLAGWILLALAGLALAVVLSVTASNLSTQPIGLSGEPLRAGDRLAPLSVTASETKTTAAKKTKPKPATSISTTPTQTATTPATTGGTGSDSDDHGGKRDSDD